MHLRMIVKIEKSSKALCCILIMSIFLGSCTIQHESVVQPVDYVDPMIGSGGHGHVFVGANVPFGAVQVGPNNIYKGWDWCSGYHYSDSLIIGFNAYIGQLSVPLLPCSRHHFV